MTEKCLCYNQKRKFFALSFSLWWCRNIKEKLWNWLTYAEMKTGPSHSVRHQHLQTCWQLTNQQQWNNFLSLTDVKLKFKTSLAWHVTGTLWRPGKCRYVNCQHVLNSGRTLCEGPVFILLDMLANFTTFLLCFCIIKG